MTIELYEDNGGGFHLRADNEVAYMGANYPFERSRDDLESKFREDAESIRAGNWSIAEYAEDGGQVWNYAEWKERYEATDAHGRALHSETELLYSA